MEGSGCWSLGCRVLDVVVLWGGVQVGVLVFWHLG